MKSISYLLCGALLIGQAACSRPAIEKDTGPPKGAEDAGGSDTSNAVTLAAGCGAFEFPSAQTLETDERVSTVLSDMTLAEKTQQMAGFDPSAEIFKTPDNELRNIRGFYFLDGPRGVRRPKDTATCFPVSVARAASWDLDLEARIGEAMGREVRGFGYNLLLAPCVNTLRHPGWGRAQETYGEDPWFLGKMGVAFTLGTQKEVPACVKHLAGNNIEDTRNTNNAVIDEQNLRENYLRQFRMIIEEGDVACVMAAYNKVNGQYCCENNHLLREVLKDEWGFDGFVVSDWYAAQSTVESAVAGLDVEMPWRNHYAGLDLAVSGGQVDEDVIDEAVTRILRTKFKYGFALLDEPMEGDRDVVESKAHIDLALEAARKGMVLLKNVGGILPLDASGTGLIKKIAVVGEWADKARLGDNGSSKVTPSYAITPYGGIKARVGENIEVVTGWGSENAEGADLAVVVVALTQEDEGEAYMGGGDRDDLGLSSESEDLINAVSALVKNTVVVIEAGGPITMEKWRESADAIVMAWYPGMEGGTALADLLFGDHNFAGRLVQTWPKKLEDEPHFGNDQAETEFAFFHGYRHFDEEKIEPLFPFGYGLSYTTFEYSNLKVSCDTISPDGKLIATLDVENTGDVDGVAVPQLYVGYPNTTARRAQMELKGFARVELKASEKKSVEIPIKVPDLAYYDTEKSAWVVEQVEHVLHAGDHARDLPLSAYFTIAAGVATD